MTDTSEFEGLIADRLNAFLRFNGRGNTNACNLVLADIVGMLVKHMRGDAQAPLVHAAYPKEHAPTVSTHAQGVLDVMSPIEAIESVVEGEMLEEQRKAVAASETMMPGDGASHEDHRATIAVVGEATPMMVVQGHDSDLPLVEEKLFPEPGTEPSDAVTSTLVHDGSGERSVHMIDVGDMPPDEAREHLNEAKAEMEAKAKKPAKKG